MTDLLQSPEAIEAAAKSAGIRNASDFYRRAPKGFYENLKQRKRLIAAAAGNKELQGELWIACARDLLFYINMFVWTYDPRCTPAALPFITYPFQDVGLLAINEAIDRQEDRLIEKSRDMGLSWMMCLVFEWRWHFRPLQSFLLGSRKEELVDKSGDPKCLMWKIDFILKHQPGWLKPNFIRQKLHLFNEDNNSTIDGESTNKDFARGDRRTAIDLDEFPSVENGYEILSATADASDCRLFTGTPKGSANAHYDVREKGETEILRFHWTLHPKKAAGLYYDETGKPRSPWYDRECKRRVLPMEIAQELDIDYLGSDYQFFDPTLLDRLMKETVREPLWKGDLAFNPETLDGGEIISQPAGPLRLWTNVDADGKPPKDRKYVIGCDVAVGTGASNSCLTIADKRTGEKVGEYASSRISPHDFGQFAVALCKFFSGIDGNGAYLIWEANGPGRTFEKAVLDAGYRHIFYRQNEKKVTRDVTSSPGWWTTKEGVLVLLREYYRALQSGSFLNRSGLAVRECREYVFLPNGAVCHSRAARTPDPTGARENHGDRVIADALCWRGVGEVDNPAVEQTTSAPDGSFGFRREQRLEKERADANEFPAPKFW